MSGVTYLLAGGVYFTLLAEQGGARVPYLPVMVGMLLGGMAASVFIGGMMPAGPVGIGLLTAGTVAGVLLGALALLSLGILVLLGGALAAVALSSASGAQKGRDYVRFCLAGGVIAVGAVGVTILPSLLPGTTVDCSTGTVTDTGGWGILGGGGGLTSSGTESVQGTTITGRSVVNGHSITFVCRRGNLVKLTGAG